MAQAALRRAATGGCAAVRVPRDDSKAICVVRFRVAIDRLPVRLSQRVVEQRRPSAPEKPPSRAREAPPPARPCCAGRLRRRRHRERLASGAHDPCASSRAPSPLLARRATFCCRNLPPEPAAAIIRRRPALRSPRRVLAARASSRRRPPFVPAGVPAGSGSFPLREVRAGGERRCRVWLWCTYRACCTSSRVHTAGHTQLQPIRSRASPITHARGAQTECHLSVGRETVQTRPDRMCRGRPLSPRARRDMSRGLTRRPRGMR